MKRITINLIRPDGELFWKGQTEFGGVVLCKSPIDNIFPIALNLNSLQMVISSNEQPGFSLIKLCQSGGYWAWNWQSISLPISGLQCKRIMIGFKGIG